MILVPLKSSECQLFNDAKIMLQRLIDENWLIANGVLKFFPAYSLGDDIEIYSDESRDTVVARLPFLRQQMVRDQTRANLCLADFIAPKSSGLADYIGLFAVTAGIGIDEKLSEFEGANDDYNSILLKSLADRLAEAFAERLHERVRTDYWGYASAECFTNEELIKEAYIGIRPAPGYPACPDHSPKRQLFDLLDVPNETGIDLTESFAMMPTASVSGYYFSHPNARYFGIGRVGRDQAEDYARRRGEQVQTAERWLAPNLAYDRS